MEEENTQNKYISLIEAYLFHYGEPVSISKISKGLGIPEKKCRGYISELENSLKENINSGLCILENGDKFQLATKPDLQDARKKIIEEEWREELTPATQETLSLVAYLGPIPKMMIDYIRGVNSSFTLRNLLIRGLVERAPSKSRKNSYDYSVSFNFLHHMGVERVEDLPDYEKFKSILKEFDMNESEN